MTRFIYLLLCVSAIGMYMFFAKHISFVFLILVLVFPICLLAINVFVLIKLKVNIEVTDDIVLQGEGRKVRIMIENPTIFPVLLSKLVIKHRNGFSYSDIIEQVSLCLFARDTTVVEYTMRSAHYGRILVTLDRIKIYDFLGITAISKKLGRSGNFSVLPQVHYIDTFVDAADVYSSESNCYSLEVSGQDPAQVFDYKEYAVGDNIKNINWKISSRMKELMVKEHSLPLSNAVLILYESINSCIDDEVGLEIADTQLETLASISHWLLRHTMDYEIEWYDKENGCCRHYSIGSQENFFSVLHNLYESSVSDQAYTINTFSEFNSREKYSRILYITPSIDENMINRIYCVGEIAPLTVLLIEVDDEALGQGFGINIAKLQIELGEKGISLLVINKAAIDSDLTKIEL